MDRQFAQRIPEPSFGARVYSNGHSFAGHRHRRKRRDVHPGELDRAETTIFCLVNAMPSESPIAPKLMPISDFDVPQAATDPAAGIC